MDLAHLGVFDPRMFFSLLFKPQEFDATGFSGFEASQYSLFEHVCGDMGPAADMQNLIMLLASKYIREGGPDARAHPRPPLLRKRASTGDLRHRYRSAHVLHRQETDNLFLRRIVGRTANARPSRRYPGYVRVYHADGVLKHLLFLIRL